MRLVIDERVENPKWSTPPKAQLTSPESIAALDFSPQTLHQGEAAMWKGDVPHFYYRLGLEDWQMPYFTLGELKQGEFDTFLMSLGEAATGICRSTRQSMVRPCAACAVRANAGVSGI